MSLLAMSLEMYSARKERMGQGEVDGFTQRVKPVLAASGFAFRSNLVGTGRAIFILFGISGVKSSDLTL